MCHQHNIEKYFGYLMTLKKRQNNAIFKPIQWLGSSLFVPKIWMFDHHVTKHPDVCVLFASNIVPSALFPSTSFLTFNTVSNNLPTPTLFISIALRASRKKWPMTTFYARHRQWHNTPITIFISLRMTILPKTNTYTWWWKKETNFSLLALQEVC